MTAVLLHLSGYVQLRPLTEGEAPAEIVLPAPQGGAGGKPRRFGRCGPVTAINGIAPARPIVIYGEIA